MTKKDIKEYFKAIRSFDLNKVKELVQNNAEYVNACSFAPPKKDDGQSGLQVSFKIMALDIASYLIENGADINFMEQSEINEWRRPVLHDCISAVFYKILSQQDTKGFNSAFKLMILMLEKGADPNKIDSFGNSSLMRAFLDTNMVINSPNFNPASKAIEQCKMVFRELINWGADVNFKNEKRDELSVWIERYRFQKYDLLNFENLPEFQETEKKGFFKRLFG